MSILDTWNEKREKAHRTFGGKLTEFDFDTGSRKWAAGVASNIETDFKFDQLCKENIRKRNLKKNFGGKCK